MTTTAEKGRPAWRTAWFRGLLLLFVLALMMLETPRPWGWLWLAAPVVVALSLLAAWRYGGWGGLVPAVMLGLTVAGGVQHGWLWALTAASACGTWMGLREEGGGAPSGVRAWMLLPALVLAAALPWSPRYDGWVSSVERELARGDRQIVEMGRAMNRDPESVRRLERTVEENAKVREGALPRLLPTTLFLWLALLVTAGRALAARAAETLRWPPLVRGRLADWRLPDAALWVLLAGLALLVAGWEAWGPTGWTLLINAGLGFSVQGIAVIESLLVSRGISPSIVFLTLVFLFTVAMPVFVVTAAALGLSDAWLDFRRLEAVPDDRS